jgi:Fe-S-cluster containining protein
MLSSILKKTDCATCRFCCSFRRQSLWESPIFDAETTEKLRALYPAAKFRPVEKASFTFDISDQYKTDDPEEEAPCPFLDSHSGCVLPPELKPFDCSIWPFRAVRKAQGELAVALTPTCPAINKVPRSQIAELLHQGGLAKKILDYAQDHPDIIKDYSEFLSDIF